ncbi:hypothetical protein DM02DRAFT_703656 [Periconia macrospinosa]|uniref:Cora-domain-containing protein n=1 Tax=Periconia macrospinosa TaxID=97972 RepID=A0A2V1DUY4_9PLEO|nr:hypothetical protein DM02DRAFT_703656 [Periconia macrospinosa]
METQSPRTQHFPHTNYGDYVRSKHHELSNSSTRTGIHWLQVVIDPLTRPDLGRAILPRNFGVSLLDIEEGRLMLKWSTCFKEQDGSLLYQESDGSALLSINEAVLDRIDELCATSNTQILVIHCLPDRNNTPVPPDSGTAMERLIDTIGSRFSLNPRFFVEHFSKEVRRYHEPNAQILPSEKDYVLLNHPNGGYITATSTSTNQATIRNSHSCTDMRCRATPDTWQELKSLKELLLIDLVELRRYLDKEQESTPLSMVKAQLLSDFNAVVESVRSCEKAAAAQAQIQTSSTAAQEAAEAYKQARSMEKLTTLVWVFIPMSFSASFFGMNINQLNNTGPNIGYFFVCVLLSLIIAAIPAILYTDWWNEIAFTWRACIEPNHTCHPREVPIAHLIWDTITWFFRKVLYGFGARRKQGKPATSDGVVALRDV